MNEIIIDSIITDPKGETKMRKTAKKLIIIMIIILTGSAAVFSSDTLGEEIPEISFKNDPASQWSFELNTEENLITFSHPEYSDYYFEVDCDGTVSDGHYMGITPVVKGVRMETKFFYNMAPFLYPVLDPTVHRIEKISIKSDNAKDVENKGDFLRVRFEGGTYRMLRPVGGDDKLYMEAAFWFAKDGLYIFVNGLYYILPSMNNTEISLITRGEERKRTITPSSEASLEYFDDVTEINVADGVFGSIDIMTYINRLQLQVHQNSGTSGFELDLDHSFKDRGQKEILSKIFMAF